MADLHNDDFQPGSMDIREQEKTYAGFLALTKWSVVAVTVVLIFLALVGA